MPQFVFLWTDIVLWAMLLLLVWYVWRVRSSANLRATWDKVLRDPAALGASIVLVLFATVTMLDSVQFRRAVAYAPGSAPGASTFYAPTSESLAESGLSCRVISIHTVKPLDVDAVLRAGRKCGAVVTVEEHSVHGGLGEARAAVLLQAGVHARMKIVGIPDEYTVTGSQADIFRHYGISMEGLAATALSILK